MIKKLKKYLIRKIIPIILPIVWDDQLKWLIYWLWEWEMKKYIEIIKTYIFVSTNELVKNKVEEARTGTYKYDNNEDEIAGLVKFYTMLDAFYQGEIEK